jgi:hypothetical protein
VVVVDGPVLKGEAVDGNEPVEFNVWLVHCPELLVNPGKQTHAAPFQ